LFSTALQSDIQSKKELLQDEGTITNQIKKGTSNIKLIERSNIQALQMSPV